MGGHTRTPAVTMTRLKRRAWIGSNESIPYVFSEIVSSLNSDPMVAQKALLRMPCLSRFLKHNQLRFLSFDAIRFFKKNTSMSKVRHVCITLEDEEDFHRSRRGETFRISFQCEKKSTPLA